MPECRDSVSLEHGALASRQVRGWRDGQDTVWTLAEEQPIALAYNRRTHAVMMASPADLADFGLGFSLSEGIIRSPSDMRDLTLHPLPNGMAVQMTIPSVHAAALIGRRRAQETYSGCGLCGIESLDHLHRDPPFYPPGPVIAPRAMLAALEQLDRHQPMRGENLSVHGAAWCDENGQIHLVREDVGRHSALDKLIGAVIGQGGDMGQGFVLLSSRCGFDLVQKAAMVGIRTLLSVSAPTGMALDVARRCGVHLAASDRRQGIVVFC